MNLSQAIVLAAALHSEQRDKAGEPYILHCLEVMRRVQPQGDDNYRVAAVLHDVVEDTETSLNHLRDNGLNETVVIALDALSRRDNESYDDYIGRVCENQIAAAVKIVDLEHNMDVNRFFSKRLRMTEADHQRNARYAKAWDRVYAAQVAKGWRKP